MFGIMSFEPSTDHRTARAAGRAAAFSVLNESAPLSGRFGDAFSSSLVTSYS